MGNTLLSGRRIVHADLLASMAKQEGSKLGARVRYITGFLCVYIDIRAVPRVGKPNDFDCTVSIQFH